MKYDVEWLNSTGFFTIKLGLERISAFLDRLGRPQDALRFIHVAGSNGKGSVCSLTESALRKAGFKTGFYSSPHLVKLTERFRVNGVPVDDETFIRHAETVRKVVLQMREENNSPTYFEITTAIALEIFRAEKVDFVLWETGMGGRLDATNVVIPEVSVITGISLEHTAYLGSTLAAVAGEKAGIIKQGVPVVCGPMPEEAVTVIKQRAAEKNAPLTIVPAYTGNYRINTEQRCQELQLEGNSISIGLPGSYQRNNASTAYFALKLLAAKFGFDFSKALSGYADARWSARFQYVAEKKLLIDGAHNPEGIQALASALREFYPGQKFHFLAGCFADKNADEVVASFAPLAEDVVFIAFDGSGREICSPCQLGALLEKYAPGTPWEEKSLSNCLQELPAENGITVLCGSLHMCGEALELLGLPG
ncbi:MAG: bifunctional folylpolyglutamate synthase/dihydrofolate synthase [Lentisphaerae bacterium]|nr:bifunctional folylpolyglutamate synthase/dihydrofolate synthase [Lentisphaerota bacterium]